MTEEQEKTLEILREAMAAVSSGRATGATVVLFNANGFVQTRGLIPPNRVAYGEAILVLSDIAARLRDEWAHHTLQRVHEDRGGGWIQAVPDDEPGS